MPQLIRPARREDATQIALVHVRSWRVTYRRVLDAGFLSALDANAWADKWRHRITEPQPKDAVLVLEGNNEVIGFVSVGAAEGPDGHEVGELQAIYLDPDQTGRGLGVLLHNAGMAALRGSGFKSAILWVGVENRRAQLFYEGNGWIASGEPITKAAGGTEMAVLRFERSL